MLRERLHVDDSLDVFAVHGVGGIFGTIMIAALGHGSMVAQLGALLIVGVFTLVLTWIIARVVRLFVPIRVSREHETDGLDLSTHGERAYDMNS